MIVEKDTFTPAQVTVRLDGAALKAVASRGLPPTMTLTRCLDR